LLHVGAESTATDTADHESIFNCLGRAHRNKDTVHEMEVTMLQMTR
jgi:hypothetical protein